LASATQIIRRRHKRQDRRAQRKGQSRAWSYFMLFLFFVVVVLPLTVFLGTASVVYAQEGATLPEPGETIDFSAVTGATRLYDREGQQIIYAVQDPLGDERVWTRLADLPPYVVEATLLVEDEDFFTASRFDLSRTFIRLWRNFVSGPIEPEASITGRLVRNAVAPQPEFVSANDRTREIALTAEISRRYTPEEILEWHLNTNDYGNEAYGIEAAAKVYLGKSARDLTIDEAALLASIPTAPQFNPVDDEVAARGRQADTLNRMLSKGAITQAQYDTAINTVTPLLPNAGQTPEVAPEFALYAREQAETILEDLLGLNGARLVSRGGLRIVTTLDLDLYYQSECALRSHLASLSGFSETTMALDGSTCTAASLLPEGGDAGVAPPDDGMIAILDVNTGEIRALVGRATNTAYQPGVTLHPFVYFEGFIPNPETRSYFTPATMVLDIPRPYTGQAEGLIYQPANPDGQYRGPLSLREAVAQGLLPPVVHIANTQGMSSVLRSAHKLGINSLDGGVYHLELLQDGGEVALLDIAYAYSVFSAMGEMRGIPVEPRARDYRRLDPVAVRRIEDADGTVLWEYDPATPIYRQNIFSDFSELGYLVNNVLSDSEARRVQFGDDNPLLVDRPAAVVNGITADRIDNWTVGYTPQLVIGVHLGRADGTQLSLTDYALSGAAPIWKAVTEYAHRRDNLPPAEWQRPENIISMEVCQRSGLLPNGVCPVKRELFLNSIVPRQVDTFWQSIRINTQTGLIATENTPPALQKDEVYYVPPAEALDWWTANRLPLPPKDYDRIYASPNDLFGDTAITIPENYAYVQGVVEIRGNVNTDNLRYYQLAYGRDLSPTQWTNIVQEETVFTPGEPLALWDTGGLDGLHTLQLTAVLQNGTLETDTTTLRIDNTPPTIILSTDQPGKIYRFPDEQVIPVIADARDNFVIERVTFYHNSVRVYDDDEFPFQYDFDITGTGIETFRAEVFDGAGNQSSSEEITVEVRR
jgi:membrane peptidoglycan carboxypeptidase